MHTPILPFHFRLVSLVRLPGAAGREVMNEAVLYHKDAQITACWTSRHVDITSSAAVVWRCVAPVSTNFGTGAYRSVGLN